MMTKTSRDSLLPPGFSSVRTGIFEAIVTGFQEGGKLKMHIPWKSFCRLFIEWVFP